MKDKKHIEHLALEINAIINRHIDEYDICLAEVVGVLQHQAFIRMRDAMKDSKDKES